MRSLSRLKKKKPARRQPRLMDGQNKGDFRRSRTLTGSISSNVRAAGEERGELQSDRLKKQTLKRHQRLLTLVLVGLLTASGGLYYLVSQYIGSAQVVYAAESSLTTQPQDRIYQEAINSFLGAHPAQRFRFALNAKELSETVSKKYPEVESITTQSESSAEAHFMVTFRQPTASWKVGAKQYFVDGNGETFEKNFHAPPPVIVTDKSGASITDGSAVASKGFLRFLGRLVALTNQSGLGDVTEATLPPNTTREIDIKLKNRGYFIKTHTDRDPAQEVEDMQRVIAYLEKRSLNPSYIDIRVSGRAYYK